MLELVILKCLAKFPPFPLNFNISNNFGSTENSSYKAFPYPGNEPSYFFDMYYKFHFKYL